MRVEVLAFEEAEILLFAMSPMDNVFAAFAKSAVNRSIDSNSNGRRKDQDGRCDENEGLCHLQLDEQDRFAEMIDANWNSFSPSKRYLRRLVRSYIRRIEEEGLPVESDSLSELVIRITLESDSLIPSPEESCYQSFLLPQHAVVSKSSKSNVVSFDAVDIEEERPLPLRIRVFPHHNSVALRLWEAGAGLAEFLLTHSELVSGCHVVELGAGVGCTGLVVAGCCNARSVHMTDYSTTCLENLEHNIRINEDWLVRRHQGKPPIVTQGYLDWCSIANEGIDSCLVDADVLIAADVVYDSAVTDSLALTIRHFLHRNESQIVSRSPNQEAGQMKEKRAIFAMTRRNMATFETFLGQLKRHSITCEWLAGENDWENIPLFFPCQFVQPRSHICIASLTVTSET